MQALRKWHTFRGDADPGTWLYAIAARACKARARRRGDADRRQIPLSQLMPWDEGTVTEIAAATPGDESQSERREAITRVQAQIARLPEHLRLPLVLKDVLELSVADTAAALGLAENTVKTRLHRARLALRKALLASASTVTAPGPIFERQVCVDLLKAKMEAIDRGGVAAGHRVPQAEVCARCRAVFRELDLVQDACARLGEGPMPTPLRRKLLRMIRDRDEAERSAMKAPRRGRRPVPGRDPRTSGT